MDRYSWDDSEQELGASTSFTGAARQGAMGLATQGLDAGGDLTPSLLSGQVEPAQAKPAGPATAPTGGQPGATKIGVGAMPGLDGITAPSGTGAPNATASPGATASATPGAAPPASASPNRSSSTASPPASVDMRQLADRVQGLSTIADPTQAARERDAVSREVATALQQAGHKVSWKGETLMVDGRPYVVAGAQPRNQAAGAASSPQMSTADPAAGGAAPAAAQGAPTPNYTYGGVIDPNKSYDPNEAFAHVNQIFAERWNRQPTKAELDALAQALGYTGGPIAGTQVQQAIAWLEKYSGNLSDPWGQGSGGGNPGGGGGGQPPGSGTPEWRAQWSYSPGDITFDDLNGLDLNSLMGRLGGPLPVGQSGPDRQTEALISSLLANPETMSPAVVNAMKARSKDELAEMGQMEDEALRNFGFDAGITDSNWLRSERLAATRDRQNALVSKNRDIDINAALTNAEDRRKAAQMGMAFSDQRFGQALASRQEERQAIQLAADTSLRASAIRGDRMALREQINAKAAELGLDADKVALQYTLGLMDDLTKRYGIDVGKDLDLKKLAEQGRQFNEELALKFAQLQFQYDELAKRDDWAQLQAGVTLATNGMSAGGNGMRPNG